MLRIAMQAGCVPPDTPVKSNQKTIICGVNFTAHRLTCKRGTGAYSMRSAMAKKCTKKTKKTQQTVTCDPCPALCCRYVATAIDEPTCKRDYDHIRWYLLHENVHVFRDHDGDWYIEFETNCSELDERGRCGIYEQRPHICSRHGNGSSCEYHSDDDPHEIRFSTASDYEDYLDAQGIKWRKKRK